MIISGFEKLTLLNYPNQVACMIFTNGCNYRCPFCQNSSLVVDNDPTRITEEEVLTYLKKRKGIIDGICISGGEPTIQAGLIDFIRKVKSLGIKVKLDTNGSRPKVLKELLDNNLLDYVAMDIKNAYNKYSIITGINARIDDINESINLLKNSKIEYEFRTTVVEEFHDYEDLEQIASLVNGSPYYVQAFEDCDNVLTKGLHGYPKNILSEMCKNLIEKFPNTHVRGIELEGELTCTR